MTCHPPSDAVGSALFAGSVSRLFTDVNAPQAARRRLWVQWAVTIPCLESPRLILPLI
jgi:hypothetical protein